LPSSTLKLEDQAFGDFLFTPQAGFGPGVYTLIHAGEIEGVLGDDNSGVIDGYDANLSQSDTEVFLTVVPEPSSIALLLAAAFGMRVMRGRLRKKRPSGIV
jgi:hypothetical protein